MASFSAAGLFGKIPAEAEFVKLRAGDALAAALVEWLEAGSEAAKRARAPASRDPVSFLFRARGIPGALVGVLAASGDRVGRSFPLALFARVEGDDLAAVAPAIPRASGAFLASAAALAAEAERLAATDLAARLDHLPLPTAAGVAAAVAEARALAAAPGSGADLLARAFGHADGGQRHYAMHCFRTACQAVRGVEPPRAHAVLSCPARGDLDRWAWLELARRALGWSVPPSSCWQDGPEARVLVALGPLPASVFAGLWQMGATDPRVWPLATDRPSAITAARRALGPRTAAALEGGALSLDELLDAALDG